MAGDSRYGGTTMRQRESADSDEYLTSTRWTFDESDDDERDGWDLFGPVRRFVRRYGWRAYALPVLVVITVAALMTTTHPPQKKSPAAPARGASPGARQPVNGIPPPASGTGVLKSDQAGGNQRSEALASDALPPGSSFTVHGNGTYQVLPGQGPVVGSGTVHRYTVDVENGITGVDLTAFAHLVDKSLDDPRSWTGNHSLVALQRVDAAQAGSAEFHVTLTSSMTVRALCGYEQQIETSCWAPNDGARVVLNVARWVRGDVAYIGDVAAYHVYMINHEVGHALGHLHSHACLADGLAPVMMQQTIGLKSVSGKICAANPWPYPPGATDAPGEESADTAQNNPRVPG